MEEKAIRGVRWTFLSYASNKVLTFVSTLVLARLLVPADFGLLALASLAIGLLGVLNDLGMWAALVLRQDFGRREQGTVFSIMLVSRTVLTVALVGAAQVLDDVFREPRLDGILSLLSVTVLIGGVTWFYDALLHRELEFGKRFAAQTAATVTYVSVTLALAIADAGVWSLVVGQIAGLVVHTGMVLALAPYRLRPTFDREAAREATVEGRGFVIQGGVSFLSQNADYFAVGRVLGAGPLGLYSLSYRLGQLPTEAIADPAVQVTFPGFARMRHRGEDIGRSFLSILRLVAFVACPLGVLLSATADPFARTLFDENWLGMIGPLAVFGIWGAIRPVQTSMGWFLNSLGEATLMGTVAAVFLVLLVPATLLAADLSGLTAVAWVMLANLGCSLLVLSYLAARRGGLPFGDQWRAVRGVVLACPLSWVAARLVAEATDGAAAGVSLGASAAAGVAVYLGAVAVLEPGALGTVVRQGRRIIGTASEGDAEPAAPAVANPAP